MFPLETISAKMLDYYVDRKDSLIIDLRDEKEYAEGHVKGAVNIPYGKFDEYRKLPEKKVLVLYCDRGGASLMLARQLAKKRLYDQVCDRRFSGLSGKKSCNFFLTMVM